MLNITAVGRLGKDPELRTTQKGQEITSFSLGVCLCQGRATDGLAEVLHLGQTRRDPAQLLQQGPTDHHQRKAV